jgi:hypothetical protein
MGTILFFEVCSLYLHDYLLNTSNHRSAQRRLSPLSEDLVEAGECEPVLDIVVLGHALNSLLDAVLTELDLLHPALDVLLRCELEHLLHLGPVTDVARAHVAAVGSEDLCVHGGELIIWEADHVEMAVDLKDGEVFREVKLVGSVGAVDDEVKVEFPWLRPALLLGDDEVLCAHLHSILLLVGRVGNDVCVSAHSNRPEKTEMSESSESDDADLLARASS